MRRGVSTMVLFGLLGAGCFHSSPKTTRIVAGSVITAGGLGLIAHAGARDCVHVDEGQGPACALGAVLEVVVGLGVLIAGGVTLYDGLSRDDPPAPPAPPGAAAQPDPWGFSRETAVIPAGDDASRAVSLADQVVRNHR